MCRGETVGLLVEAVRKKTLVTLYGCIWRGQVEMEEED